MKIITSEEINEMIRLYTVEKLSIIEIAKSFNIGEKRQREILKSNNVTITKPKKNNNAILTTKDEQKIVELYKNGYSLRKINTIYKTTRNTLSDVVKKYGLEVKLFNPKTYSCNENYFETIDTEDKAYWLGFLYADGSIDEETKSKLSIVLKKSDFKHLEKLKKCLDSNHVVRFYKQSRHGKINEVCVLTISSKKICEDLIKLGCVPNKTYCLEYPEKELLNGFEIDMIRGFIDGNGTISINMNRVGVCGRLNFIENIAKVLYPERQCKFFPTSENKIAYNFHVSNLKDFIRVTTLLYKDKNCYLDRKNPFKDKDVF